MNANTGLGLEFLMNRKKTSSIDGMSQRSGADTPPPSVCDFGGTGGGAGRAGSIRSVSLSAADTEDSASVVNVGDDFQNGFETSTRHGGGSGGGGWRPPPRPPASMEGSEAESSYRPSPHHRERDRAAHAQDELNQKYEILYQLERLEKRGVQLPRKFTLSSSLEEMKSVYERVKREREVDNAVRFQRTWLVNCINGIEYLNGKFDPFDIRLDGWGESVQDNITDYNDVLEELAEKYRGRGKMAPELKLLMMVSGSAVMCHMQNRLFKNMPGAEQVLQQNPELARQFAAATMNTMAKDERNDGASAGLAGMLGSLFGGTATKVPGPAAAAPPAAQAAGVRHMQGPGDVDDLLKELHQQREVPIRVTVNPAMAAVDDEDIDSASDISLENLLSQ